MSQSQSTKRHARHASSHVGQQHVVVEHLCGRLEGPPQRARLAQRIQLIWTCTEKVHTGVKEGEWGHGLAHGGGEAAGGSEPV